MLPYIRPHFYKYCKVQPLLAKPDFISIKTETMPSIVPVIRGYYKATQSIDVIISMR